MSLYGWGRDSAICVMWSILVDMPQAGECGRCILQAEESTVKQIIWGALFSLLLATAATAAETGYPPPPPAGKPLSVEDSIYGVLRNHHNLRGMIEKIMK